MSVINPATANTDKVGITDRAAGGPKPDNTPVGGPGATGGGGGGPTGPAGGDLTGTYPNPTLAAIVAATGPIGDATHVAAVTIDAKGRVTTLTSVAITAANLPSGGAIYQRLAKNSATNYDAGWYGPDVFNVADYGMVPNNTGVGGANVTAFNAAAAAAVSYSGTGKGATIYFPDGLWYVNSVLTVTFGNSNYITVKGNGQNASFIVIQTASQDALKLDLSNAGDTTIKNHGTVCELGFLATAGITGNRAIWFDYGTAAFDQHYNGGSTVRDIFIYNNNSNSGGYTYGVHLLACWASSVLNVWGYGNSSTYTAASVPGAGDGGAGSGAFIIVEGGVNQLLTNLYYEYWSEGVQIVPLGGIGAAGLVPQGTQITNISCVETFGMLHAYQNSGGHGADGLKCINWQCDNGNTANNGHRTMVLVGGSTTGGDFIIGDGYTIQNGTTYAHIELLGANDCILRNIIFGGATTVLHFGADPNAVNSSHSIVTDCIFGAQVILLDAGSTANQVNNTGTATWTDNDGGNLHKTTVW